jgi:CubicO group peptidase (beta-lactamase class C family)
VLEIAARQKALNFDPGTKWSYSNTGFNLAAIIVSRVSGMSFAEFSKRRIFAPLGMTHTSWRDDHTRIVKGRAIAYARQDGEYHIEMPFENVHGNGGLLTTVGDLLIMNENFVAPKVGSPKTLSEMQTVGRFNDGTPLDYGLGLYVNNYRGVKNVYHSGSTAGYRAHLNRFPESRTSVAVLCNGADADATRSANWVSEIFLGLPPIAVGGARGTPMEGPPVPAAEIARFAGDYWSEEAETTLTVALDGPGLVVRRRPDTVINLTRIGDGRFRGSIGEITFIRNASGAVEALSIKQDRVWDLRFVKR